MRTGVSVPPFALPFSEIPSWCGRAEELGYTDVWTYEGVLLDGFTPATLAAAGTRSLRIGIGIIPAFTRPAGLIAMSAAALALAAPGRFVLGLGSSTKVIVEDWMGIPFERPRQRTVETARTVRALLAGERVGRFRLALVPQPAPEIWLAGLGPKMLASVTGVADGVCFFLVGPKLLPTLIEEAGGLPSMERLLVHTGSDEEARRALIPYALSPGYQPVLRRQGFGEEIDGILARWAAGDRAAAPGQVSDAMLQELLLRGDADAIQARLQDYAAAGLGTAALQMPTEMLEPLAPRAS